MRDSIYSVNCRIRRGRFFVPWFLRIVLGVILLTASTLKAVDFALNFWSGDGRSVFAFAQLAIAELELLLSVLLFCGLWQHALRRVLIGLFSVFILRLLYLSAFGESTCGCLGERVDIPIPVMLSVDVVVLLLLVTFGLHPKRQSHPNSGVSSASS